MASIGNRSDRTYPPPRTRTSGSQTIARLATSAPIWSHTRWSNTSARSSSSTRATSSATSTGRPKSAAALARDTPAAEGLFGRYRAVSGHSWRRGALGEPVADLAGRPVGPLDDLSADDESGGDAGPKVEVDARSHAGERTPRKLGKRCQLHVVSERRWQRGKRLVDHRGDREVLPARDIGCEIDVIDAGQPHCGHADGTDVTTARPLLAEHLFRESDRRLEHPLGAAFGLGRQRSPTMQLPSRRRRSPKRSSCRRCLVRRRRSVHHSSSQRRSSMIERTRKRGWSGSIPRLVASC